MHIDVLQAQQDDPATTAVYLQQERNQDPAQSRQEPFMNGSAVGSNQLTGHSSGWTHATSAGNGHPAQSQPEHGGAAGPWGADDDDAADFFNTPKKADASPDQGRLDATSSAPPQRQGEAWSSAAGSGSHAKACNGTSDWRSAAAETQHPSPFTALSAQRPSDWEQVQEVTIWSRHAQLSLHNATGNHAFSLL